MDFFLKPIFKIYRKYVKILKKSCLAGSCSTKFGQVPSLSLVNISPWDEFRM